MAALLWVIHSSSLGKPPPVALHKDQSLIAQEDKKQGSQCKSPSLSATFPQAFTFVKITNERLSHR